MLKSIRIENCFAHTNSYYEFSTGMTAITGPNGTGKSQILEMIRFALFGAQALRTEAVDYKGAKVTLEFSVRGVTHQVIRTATSAKLFREGDLVVTGTRPVNIKIVETFGYGLDVFDTANVANQGAIEALSAMRPAERKRLVDSTVGLNLIDDLAKWCADEAANRSKEAAAVRSVLVEPVPPVKPEGYRPAAELAQERAQLVALADEWRGLKRIVIPDDVPRPEETETRSLEVLSTLLGQRTAVAAHVATMEKQLLGMPEPVASEEEIDRWQEDLDQSEAHNNAIKLLAAYPAPLLSQQHIEEQYRQHNARNDYTAWKKLRDAGSHVCPKCSHSWPVKLHQMETDWEGKEEPLAPIHSVPTLRAEHERHRARMDREAEITNAHMIVKAKGYIAVQVSRDLATMIYEARQALAKAPHRAALIEQKEASSQALATMPDVASAIATRKVYERKLAVWQATQDARAQLPIISARLAELDGVAERAEAASVLLTEVTVYDRMMAGYEAALAKYAEGLAKVQALDDERQQYTLARAALAEVKSRVKHYLVPSLSKVSSGILNRMTGGAFTDVHVNEDFDIKVDGIAIDGMSGAGKAAANLALRIGLGQVLTNKVFSVFCADEVDASMDDSRAEYNAQCLRNLTGTIGQIVLVSHKRPDADHYINL